MLTITPPMLLKKDLMKIKIGLTQVFDSFSHPFLPCQCLFTFCVVWRINLRTISHDQNAM
jgi:hypothetical protein